MRNPKLLSIALLTCLACSSGKRATNDTGLGDDAGIGTEDGGEGVAVIMDHGMAQFCVDRWVYNGMVSNDLAMTLVAAEIENNERWWSPSTRSYVGALDIDDKPSPMIVPPMCGAEDPFWDGFGIAPGDSCLVSGYHVQLPEVVSEPEPGSMQWPYSKSIVYGTIGNPPESGRHTWMAEPCCNAFPIPEEKDEWALVGREADLIVSKEADCRVHVFFKGTHSEAGGYPSPHDYTARIDRAALTSKCVLNHGYYNPATLAPIKAVGLNQWIPWHPTRKQMTTPLNLNYDWVASWGLISFKDFAAFGATIDAVIQSLLAVLYLPPNGFEHPRYGGGSGCAYHAALKYEAAQWIARVTCPYGYFEVLPDFDSEDLGTRIDGIVGHCELDGIGGTDPGADGVVDRILDSGERHRYRVNDVEKFANVLDDSGAYASVELSALFEDIEPGDSLEWWSSPGYTQTPGEDLRRTLGYDLDDLIAATGWSYDRAQKLADQNGPVPLSKLIDGLPIELQDRRAYTLRAGNVWRLRVERGSYVMFFYFE